MKRNYFKLVAILIIAIGIISCKKETVDQVHDLSPSIILKTGADYYSADDMVNIGEEFIIGINASSNTFSSEKLVHISYTVTSNNGVILEHDSIFSESLYEHDYIFLLNETNPVLIKFEVVDINGQNNSFLLQISPVDLRPNIDFKVGNGYTSTDDTVAVGASFTIGIYASSSSLSKEKLARVRYSIMSDNNVISQYDSVFNESLFDHDYQIILSETSPVMIKFEVVDIKGRKDSLFLKIVPLKLHPNIDFKVGNAYISSDAVVSPGQDFTIGITAHSNVNSGRELKSVKYTVSSNNVVVLEFDSVFNEISYNLDYVFNMSQTGEAVFSFVVTDKDGQINRVSLTVIAKSTPLGIATNTYFERVGGANATGLDGFGLKWTSNLKSIHAVIAKDVATKLVLLTAAEWTSIATVEALTAAVDAAADLDSYEGISVENNADYDDVIACVYNDEYYMIHLTSAVVEVGTYGMVVEVFGQSKK